jgi:hypothetical protein
MNAKIADDLKSAVIHRHLKGESRNEIARTCGLGEGTVSNIIYEWTHSLSNCDAESLRELAVNLKRLDIDPARCSIGFRTAMIMNKTGINEAEFESFMREVYGYCQQAGLTPDQIASNLKPLVELSKSVPLGNIPQFIEEKQNQVKKLEKEIEGLQKQKKDLNLEVSSIKELRDVALQEERMTSSELGSYSRSKKKLEEYGISLDNDIPKLAQLIMNIENHGYDPEGILSEYFDLQSVKAKRDEVERQITMLERRKSILEHDCEELQDEESKHFQTLIAYNQLKSIGFGLQELKILKYTIAEVAKAQNVSEESAVTAFFQQLRNGSGIEYGGHNNKVSFDPSLWPFFDATVGGSNNNNRGSIDKKQNKEELQQEMKLDNPLLNSFSKSFFQEWHLFQDQHQLQARSSSTTTQKSRSPGVTSIPHLAEDIIKNVNLEFVRHLYKKNKDSRNYNDELLT